ncbi:MAG TPA: trypsin-like peptidase domain-containing protein [Anaerolineales bacterium]|nr:trypsin-like peptidase domain-containing protein [Anaerolineales bacterium]
MKDTRGIARIFREASIVGAGFLVGRTTVITCAHVIDEALNNSAFPDEKPKGELRLDFPLLQDKKIYMAFVADWWPREPDGSGDIAVLTLHEPIQGVENVCFLDEKPVWGREVLVFGYPEGPGYQDGQWIKGLELGRNGLNLMQIEAESNSFLQRGFSGAPVWDAEAGGIVGMVVVADTKQRVGFAIPVETLLKTFPNLPTQPSPAQKPIPFFVPYPHQPQILGREPEIKDLHRQLTTSPTKTVTLFGMGGIGKTTLALQYAHQFKRLYSDGVYWFNAATPLLHEFADLARKLEKATSATEETDAARLAWLHLKNLPNALLIFDDIEEPAQLKDPFAPGLTALDLPGWRLLTSRKKSIFPTVEVHILDEDAARQLLSQSA